MTEIGTTVKPFVLVVEDEPDVCSLLCEYFEAEGFRVTSATDGWQAVVQTEGLKLDLIVCDIMMPGPKGSGFDAYKGLRESLYVRKNMPILFVTAMQLDKVRSGLPADPLVRILGKPVDFKTLRATVKELIGR
jgi:DNA-binding response OmpR family regulator